MILVYTSLHRGAMLQYTLQLVKSLTEIGKEALAIIPDDSVEILSGQCVTYKRGVAYSTKSNYINNLSELLLSYNPDNVIMAEYSLNTALLTINLSGKTKIFLTVHDAKHHPSNNIWFKIKEYLKNSVVENSFKSADYLLFMSEGTLKTFMRDHPGMKYKAKLLPLGAHVPEKKERIPQELSSFPDDYILFFGRIDKYKGISRLLKAYLLLVAHGFSKNIVLAGKGIYTDEERMLIDKLKAFDCITVINRFIDDGEMKWLFSHCAFLCLPYIEASQSGVLPMAYYYGKPVIISNIEGLSQFVDIGRTGYVFDSIEQLSETISFICDNKRYLDMREDIFDYASKYLSWTNNLKRIFQ